MVESSRSESVVWVLMRGICSTNYSCSDRWCMRAADVMNGSWRMVGNRQVVGGYSPMGIDWALRNERW